MTMQATQSKMQGTSESQRLRLRLVAAEHVERIGARIRERREELDLTRRALSNLMQGSVTENDLYRWETARHRPQDDTLADLARALEVDPAYFMTERAQPPTAGPDLLAVLDGGVASHLERVDGKLDALNAKLDAILAALATTPADQLADEAFAALDAASEPAPPESTPATEQPPHRRTA